jgi:hypothetical protein
MAAGTRAARILIRLGFSIPLAREVECLLALHPLDARFEATRDGELRRLVKRAGDTDLDRLFTLRDAELEIGSIGGAEAGEIRARLSLLRDAIGRLKDGRGAPPHAPRDRGREDGSSRSDWARG